MKSSKFALESEGAIRAEAPMLPLLASGSERQGEVWSVVSAKLGAASLRGVVGGVSV